MKPPIYHRIWDYRRSLLPNDYLGSLEEGVDNIDDARKVTGATIGHPGWGLIYHILLSHLDRNRNEVLLETGTNFGCTTIILAQALIDARCQGSVLTLEMDREAVEVAEKNIEKAGVSAKVDILCGNSIELIPKLSSQLSDLRFAFLDASHLYDDVLAEFEAIYHLLADDAIVLFDNTYNIAETNEDQRVYGALKTIKNKYGGEMINLEYVSWFTPGLTIWQKSRQR